MLTPAKALLKPLIPDGLLERYHIARNGRFTCMQWATDGLLTAEVYEALYDAFFNVQNDIIEVGGAAGSASISIAWALQESDTPAQLIVVEKCEGGTRIEFGGYESNLERYQRFTTHYGVADRIRLFPHYLTMENGDAVNSQVETANIGGLMLDADGQIHRDFALFWTRLVLEAPIVIDDYHPDKSPKHALTWALLNQFLEWDLIHETYTLGETFFGTRGPVEAFSRHFDYDRCEAIAQEVCSAWRVTFNKCGLQHLANTSL